MGFKMIEIIRQVR